MFLSYHENDMGLFFFLKINMDLLFDNRNLEISLQFSMGLKHWLGNCSLASLTIRILLYLGV